MRLFLGTRPFPVVSISADGLSRLDNGRRAFARAIKTLLVRNDLSHAELRALSQWASPGNPSWLSTSQISYLRTGRLKAIGPKTIDALGQLNLHLAKVAGDDSPEVVQLPKPAPLPDILKHRLQRPFFLRHPTTGLACTAGDLTMIWLGRLLPADLAEDGVSAREARRVSEALSVWLQQWCIGRGMLFSRGIPQILEAYPVREKSRREKLQTVIAGLSFYEPDDLLQEREALAQMIFTLHGSEPVDAPGLDLLMGSAD